jgi:hypothetical protein
MLAGKIGYFRASLDPAAAAYLAAVEIADGQALESAVRAAINNFIVGCKTDGIWSAIKASCILCGARTLSGALVPLVGAAPTNFNFVAGDYNRKTGLVGNGSNKYLNSNRAGTADPQNNLHLSVYVTAANVADATRAYIGNGQANAGASHILTQASGSSYGTRSRNQTFNVGANNSGLSTGFIGVSRQDSAAYGRRIAGTTSSVTQASDGSDAADHLVFNRTTGTAFANGRLAFYSIGEGLTLASLDSRVTALYNAIGAAIP